LLGGVIWAGVYARKRGFSHSWRQSIEREFADRGYYTDIGKVTLGAVRGLRAEDIQFFSDPSRTEKIAFVDDAYIDVDLSQIFDSKKLTVNTIDIDKANLSLPIPKPDGSPSNQRLNIEDVSGRMILTESIIEILRAEGKAGGVQVSAKGSLFRPPQDQSAIKLPGKSAPSRDARDSFDTLSKTAALTQRFAKIIKEVERYESIAPEPPTLDISFRGDLRDLSTINAKGTFNASQFRKKGQSHLIADIIVQAEFDGASGQLNFPLIELYDSQGSLSGNATWDQKKGVIDVEMESSADIVQLVSWYWNDRRLRRVVFFKPPRVAASGKIDLNKWSQIKQSGKQGWHFPGAITGELIGDNFGTSGEVYDGISGGFSFQGEKLYFRNVSLSDNSGIAYLNLMIDPTLGEKTVQYQTEVRMDPRVFKPFVKSKEIRDFFDLWELSSGSAVFLRAAGLGETLDPASWTSQGELDIREFRFKGVTFNELDTDFQIQAGQAWYRNLQVAKDEATLRAELIQNEASAKQLWTVRGLVSDLDPQTVAPVLNPVMADVVKDFSFDTRPTIKMNGVFDGRSEEALKGKNRAHDFTVELLAKGEVHGEVGGRNLFVIDPEGKIEVKGSRVHLKSFELGMLGGRATMEYDHHQVGKQHSGFDLSVELEEAKMNDVMRWIEGPEMNQGQGKIVLNISGNRGDFSSFRGHGGFELQDIDFRNFPTTSELITSTDLPDSPWSFSGAFQVQDGKFTSKNLEAQCGDVLTKTTGELDAQTSDIRLDLERFSDEQLKQKFKVEGPWASPDWEEQEVPRPKIKVQPTEPAVELSGQ
ncbi:MAG: hypothetical protein AAF226_08185, partial [Verrucomicrobiota bacterium]